MAGYRSEYYQRHREKFIARAKAYRDANPEAREDARLRRMFGISLQEYRAMVEAQFGLCAICFNPETIRHRKNGPLKKLTVDHDHVTGKVRGLVCQKCNSILGYAGDQVYVLRSAIAYLKEAARGITD